MRIMKPYLSIIAICLLSYLVESKHWDKHNFEHERHTRDVEYQNRYHGKKPWAQDSQEIDKHPWEHDSRFTSKHQSIEHKGNKDRDDRKTHEQEVVEVWKKPEHDHRGSEHKPWKQDRKDDGKPDYVVRHDTQSGRTPERQRYDMVSEGHQHHENKYARNNNENSHDASNKSRNSKYHDDKYQYLEHLKERDGKWVRNEAANEISDVRPHRHIPDPPDHKELIPMARYVMHNADWASIATISSQRSIEGFPFSNVKSLVDGSINNSTGIPYFYMSPLDFTAKDLSKNSKSTVMVSLEETRYCEKEKWDPEDPRCTRVMLSGKMKRVKDNSTEYVFAKAALFERHPAMANFPADHDFFVAKLKIAQIAMVDWFGGAKFLPVRDYLAFNYTEGIKTLKLHKS